MSTEILPIETLVGDAANVRVRDERAAKTLDSSLRRFGPARSIVVDERGIVRAGNGTLEAAQRAGVKEVLVVDPEPGQLVAVRRREWSPTEATAYAIADNRTADLSMFDDAALRDTLAALEAEAFDLDAIGFTADELAKLTDAVDDEVAPAETIAEKWLVVIECDSESRQTSLLERFLAEGLTCRALTS